MNFDSPLSRPHSPFPQAWSAQDLADAVPLRLFETVDFDAAQLPGAQVHAGNTVEPLARNWRRQDYLSGARMPAYVRVR